MKLGKLETLLPEANAIDLGCGADGGALPFLLKEEGVRPIGVERNPSRENRTLLTTEVELREHQLGFPGSEAAQFSCYPFYPNKHRQAGAQVSGMTEPFGSHKIQIIRKIYAIKLVLLVLSLKVSVLLRQQIVIFR